MAKKSADDLKAAVNDLANSSPVVTAGRAIAAVGEAAQDLYDKGSRAAKKAAAIILPGQGPRDIQLPADRKKKR